MAKVTKRSNYRVVTELYSRQYSSEEQYRRHAPKDAESIKESIRRHVDDIGDVYIECDSQGVCSFCGRDWEVITEDMLADDWDTIGMPVCCQDAIDEFESEKKEAPR